MINQQRIGIKIKAAIIFKQDTPAKSDLFPYSKKTIYFGKER